MVFTTQFQKQNLINRVGAPPSPSCMTFTSLLLGPCYFCLTSNPVTWGLEKEVVVKAGWTGVGGEI